MKKGEFISVARRMVKEYLNYHVIKGKEAHVRLTDITVIGFSNIEGDLKCILYSLKTPGISYKVTYNKETKTINSEKIKMDGFRR